jgi:PPP family 3-phenylpropionic acid transporter
LDKLLKHTNLKPFLLYFLFYAAAGATTPFLNVLYQSKGLTIDQISILAALPMGLTLVAAPIWAGIADFFGLHRQILPLMILLTIPLMALIGIGESFIVLLPIVLLYGFCYSPITSLQDNSVLSYMGNKRNEYGKVRVGGSIGWALIGLVTGVLIGQFGSFVAYTGTILFTILHFSVALRMPKPEIEKGDPYWTSLRKLARDNRWYGFLAGALLVGISFMFINSYFLIFLKSLGASSSIQGLSVFASSILEIPFFIFSAVLIKKFSSRVLMQFSFVILIIRLILISLLKDPNWGVAIQLLHGIFFSTFWAGGVNYASEIAPKGLSASAQALFGASFFGLGGILGALLGGWLFVQISPVIMFQVGAGLTLMGLLLITFWARPKNVPIRQ